MDRDGVINPLVWNPLVSGYDSPHRRNEAALLPGVVETLEALVGMGFLLFIVSNQPSAAKGKCTLKDLERVHLKLLELIGKEELIEEYFYCYHHPEAVVPELRQTCLCRKPGHQLLKIAERKYCLDLKSSWMIGDRDVDVICGKNAGTKTILLNYPLSAEYRLGEPADYMTGSLPDVLDIVN